MSTVLEYHDRREYQGKRTVYVHLAWQYESGIFNTYKSPKLKYQHLNTHGIV
jgi:hypothetical protein